MQPTRRVYVLSWLVYGLSVVASGCYRYFSRPDGEKGLYFGLVMGTAAIAAAALLARGRPRAGHVAGLTSLVFVAGWFVYESLIKDGGSHEFRLMLVAGLSCLQAAIVVVHFRGAARR